MQTNPLRGKEKKVKKGIVPAPRIHFILDSSLAIPCLSLRVVGYSFLHWLNPLLVSELGFSLLSLG